MTVAEDWEVGRLGECAGRGTPAAFEALVRCHERAVLGVALRLLGRMEDAQDVAQEVFLRLHRNLGGLASEASRGSWLYRVTVNLCRDRWRSVKRRREVVLDGVEIRTDSGFDPEAQVIARERLLQVRAALFRLGEKERLALVLRDVEGFSTDEVARLLGVKEITVRVQISKARLKLRESLKAGSRRFL